MKYKQPPDRHLAAQRIRQARIERGLSTTRLAQKVGTSQQNISRWERGARIPPEMLKRIADAFDLSMDYFVDPEILPVPKAKAPLLKDSQTPSWNIAPSFELLPPGLRAFLTSAIGRLKRVTRVEVAYLFQYTLYYPRSLRAPVHQWEGLINRLRELRGDSTAGDNIPESDVYAIPEKQDP